jgi:hypothetical protein
MRIGFDMDGVIADLHATFVDTALGLYPDLDRAAMAPLDVGASPPETDDEGTIEMSGEPAADTEAPVETSLSALPLSRRQIGKVWDEIVSVTDFWEGLRETEPGIVQRIAATAEERRWEVIFLTSRPKTAGETVQRQSQRWLHRLGFALPSVYVVQESRGKIAAALGLDVVIDDRPDNCLDVVLESKARAVLIWRRANARPPAAARRLGIGVQATVASCLDVLIEAERAADTPADLMQRLRRLFGLSRSPSASR